MTPDEFRVKRINAGKSRRGLARELEIPEQTLRRYEAGLGISLANAKKLADYLGLKVTDLPPFREQAAA